VLEQIFLQRCDRRYLCLLLHRDGDLVLGHVQRLHCNAAAAQIASWNALQHNDDFNFFATTIISLGHNKCEESYRGFIFKRQSQVASRLVDLEGLNQLFKPRFVLAKFSLSCAKVNVDKLVLKGGSVQLDGFKAKFYSTSCATEG